MVRVVNQLRTRRRSRLDSHSWLVVRQMGPQHRCVRHAPCLRRPDCFALNQSRARRAKAISRAPVRRAPTISIFYCFNIFSKLAVGALSGFEYVAILAGETRAPARDIGRSVIIASPVIALMFILGTSAVLAFIGNNPIDLIGPVPQTLRLGLRSFPIAGVIASMGIVLMTVRSISSTSVP